MQKIPFDFYEFKKYVNNSLSVTNPEQQTYRNLISEIEKCCALQRYKFFYAKNCFNQEETLLYFLSKDGFMVACATRNEVSLRCSNSRLIGKHIDTCCGNDTETILELSFASGENLVFNSQADSCSEWVNEYSHCIKNIFCEI